MIVTDALGRPEDPLPIAAALTLLSQERVLITGGLGSLGMALYSQLGAAPKSPEVLCTDVDTLDVRDSDQVWEQVTRFRPTVVFHLAGAKHAPAGEESPWDAARINTWGTRHVLRAAEAVDAHVVTASTCKACNPETAYGATKLIAERLTLNAGGTVARFYNVVETQDNVFDIWGAIPTWQSIPYTDCYRYFMSKREAVSLLLWASQYRGARLCFDPGKPRSMQEVARDCYPDRHYTLIPRRRGDRFTEPRHGEVESTSPTASRMWRVTSPHDGEVRYHIPVMPLVPVAG